MRSSWSGRPLRTLECSSTRSSGHPWETGRPVRCGVGRGKATFLLPNSRRAQTLQLHPRGTRLPMACGQSPVGGHLSTGHTPVPPLHRSLSQGTWAWRSCLASEATWSMRSPSWPTTGMGPAVTQCPSATPPVGDPCSAPQLREDQEQPRGIRNSPSSRGPGPQTPRTVDSSLSP